MPTVHVVGSVNLDLVASVGRLPHPGETVTGATLARHPGGKGANQALAAARMGSAVTLSAAVGDDEEAATALAVIGQEPGVVLDVATLVDAPTGIALIAVDAAGENQIVVAPGANVRLHPDHLPDRIDADAVLCQLEVPIATVRAALERTSGLKVLNAAPALASAGELVPMFDVVIVNQPERTTLADSLDVFEGLLVTTLGPAGAIAERGGVREVWVAPPPVRPIDTVGAGDAFCGALVTELAANVPLDRAMAMATTAGALATEVPGAQPSLPRRADVEARCPGPS